MTAPDRIWITDKEVCGYFWEESELHLEEAFEPNVEYIRKGAFPVEELKEALDDRYGSETAVAFRAEYKLMERILSLLEGNNDE